MPMKCQHHSESWTKNPYLVIPTRMNETCSAWSFIDWKQFQTYDIFIAIVFLYYSGKKILRIQTTHLSKWISLWRMFWEIWTWTQPSHHRWWIWGYHRNVCFFGNICMHACIMSWNTIWNMFFWLFDKIVIKSVIKVFKLTCVVTVSVSVMDEIWRQQTVLRLLQLIDLPLLESLLEGQESPRPPLHSMDSDPDLLYTSSYLDREILKAFSEAQYAPSLFV